MKHLPQLAGSEFRHVGTAIIDILAALPKQYYPALGCDPYEEDACGGHEIFTVHSSGLGIFIDFVDGRTAYFDDDGEFVFKWPEELCGID